MHSSRVALALALAALAPACRSRRARPRARTASLVAGRWNASLPAVEALRVLEGHYLVGGVRRTDTASAPPPFPARPLVSAARVADGWRFAAADGTLYAAREFLAPLRVLAAVPESARPGAEGLARGVVRGVFHDGALAYLDQTGRAWTLDGSTPRALPLTRVLSVVFASARVALAVTAPGALHRSDDGGRTFSVVPLPAGDLAAAVGLVRGVPVVESYHGRYSVSDAGDLRADPGGASLESFVRAGDLPPTPDAVAPLLLPTDPTRVAALPDETLALVEGDTVRVIDPRTRRELRRIATPGQGCVIAGAHGSFRLVCTHEGWAGGALAVWGRAADGALVLHRGAIGPADTVRWTSHAAPTGARRGISGSGGVAYALGAGADELWEYRPAVGFARMPGPVRGDASALALDPEGLSYCAGPVCRLAGVLEWTAGASEPPWFITRADAAPPPPPTWVSPPQRAAERAHYECASGETLGAGPELDRGIAVSGYALHWTPERDGVTVQWNGATFSGVARGRLPPTAEAVTFTGYAPVGATTPVALLDRCAGARCETFLASGTGLQPFPLEHFAHPYRRDLLQAEGTAVLALARGVAHGVTVAQAILFDLRAGEVVAQRSVVSEAPPEFIQAGSLDGRDGLWLPTSPRRWRFVPLAGEEAREETVEDDGTLAPCAPGVTARGVLRRLDRGAEIQGAGWAPMAGEWQVEEILAVTAQGLCVRAIAGGESRDESAFTHQSGESDPVRSFALTADGAGHLTGVAWQGRRRFAMSCARVEARRTLLR